jgi:hypothetical protein
MDVWCMPVIPTLRRLRQDDYEFKACLGYIERPFSGKEKKKRKERGREEGREGGKGGRKEGRKGGREEAREEGKKEEKKLGHF